MNEFHFLRPWWLFALVILVAWFWWRWRYSLNSSLWQKICDKELLPHILTSQSDKRQHKWTALTIICALLGIIALAGPVFERLPSPVFRDQAALVIALDLSRSMDATDIKPSRIARARFKIADILKKRQTGQTALIVYAGDAFSVTPLTDDTKTILSQLSALNTALVPSQGSDTNRAITLAKKLLQQSGARLGDILLVTDEIEKAINSTPYRLSILGVGSADGAPIKNPDGGFLKDASGNIVLPKLNAAHLSKTAQQSGGLYRTIADNDSDIDALIKGFSSRITKDNNKELLVDNWREFGVWLLPLLLLLTALFFRRGIFMVCLMVIFGADSVQANPWQTDNQKAYQQFQNQDYKSAAQNFSDSAWQASAWYKAGDFDKAAKLWQDINQPEYQYNLGNALAQSGKLQEAIAAYDRALAYDPDNQDALDNKIIAEKTMAEKNQQNGNDRQSQSKKNQQNRYQENSKKDQQRAQQSEQPFDDKKLSDNMDENSQPKSDKSDDKSNKELSDKKNQDDKKNVEKPQQSNLTEVESDDKIPEKTAQKILDTETAQAKEQWLKTIKDDPAGLLKRKFFYQYHQRNNPSTSEKKW